MTIKPSCAVLILSGVFFLEGKAANCPVPCPVMVSQVSFYGGKTVDRDNTVPMDPPHWEDKENNADSTIQFPDGNPDVGNNGTNANSIKSLAYSYACSQTAQVEAVFIWKTPPTSGEYFAKGVASAPNCSFSLPEQKLVEGNTKYTAISGSSSVTVVPRIQGYVTENRKIIRQYKDSNGQMVDLAKDLKPVEIKWTVYHKVNGVDVIDGESISKHTLYITLAIPHESLASGQETLFNVACETADGCADANLVTDLMWREFTDREVKKMDKTAMKYYGSWNTQYATSKDLISWGDGQCTAWQDFFISLRAVHRIVGNQTRVQVTAASPSKGLFVKEWNFGNVKSSGDVDFPYMNVPASTGYYGNNTYTWSFWNVVDAVGLAGQGTSNPFSIFQLHQIVIDGVYYDPSYGIKYGTVGGTTDAALLDMAKSSIAGYYKMELVTFDENAWQVDFNGNGVKTDHVDIEAFMIKENNAPAGSQLVAKPF